MTIADAAPTPPRLAGRWRLDRTLHDRAAGLRGCVHGALEITPRGCGYDWTESGVLTWGEMAVPVTRRLRLEPRPDGWWLTFTDGRDFHPWLVGEPVVHPCRADLYRGLVTAPSERTLRIRWDVTGPAKDHRYVTVLRRPT